MITLKKCYTDGTKIEANAEKIGERGSMSRTDEEATFMLNMGNGRLKPAYNVQKSSEEGVITNYTMHQMPGDTTTYIEHTETHKEMYGEYPDESVADAGYGSEDWSNGVSDLRMLSRPLEI